MNPAKIVIALVVLACLGVAAYTFSPGLRAKMDDVVDKVVGWTDEARRDDPVGYVEYALEKLAADLGRFRDARSSLAETKQGAQDKLAENEQLNAAAIELSGAFREQYGLAEGSQGYPVTVAGEAYDHDQLVSQVQLVLAQRDTYASAVVDLEAAVATMDETANHIESRIIETQKNITLLETKLEVLKIEKLTAETEQLLTNVEALLHENEDVLSDPVRTVEELLNALQSPEAEPAPDARAAALEFLGT